MLRAEVSKGRRLISCCYSYEIMIVWRIPKLIRAYCVDCGAEFNRLMEAKKHAELYKHKVRFEYR